MKQRYKSWNLLETDQDVKANNAKVLKNTKYQDLVESLNVNKQIKGLLKYVGEHILSMLIMNDSQTVALLVTSLRKKYGKFRIERQE